MNILSYHVLHGFNNKWIDADEKSWTESFIESAFFNDIKKAQEVGERICIPTNVFYVMACVGIGNKIMNYGDGKCQSQS